MITGPIRQDGPIDHIVKKSGTPTMGGIIIVISMTASTLLWSDLGNTYVWTLIFVSVFLAFLGFLDDFLMNFGLIVQWFGNKKSTEHVYKINGKDDKKGCKLEWI